MSIETRSIHEQPLSPSDLGQRAHETIQEIRTIPEISSAIESGALGFSLGGRSYFMSSVASREPHPGAIEVEELYIEALPTREEKISFGGSVDLLSIFQSVPGPEQNIFVNGRAVVEERDDTTHRNTVETFDKLYQLFPELHPSESSVEKTLHNT
jgi:hypothetical protein